MRSRGARSPVTRAGLFGEYPADRRARLRELVLRGAADAGLKRQIELEESLIPDAEEDAVRVRIGCAFWENGVDVRRCRKRCGTIPARRSSTRRVCGRRGTPLHGDDAVVLLRP